MPTFDRTYEYRDCQIRIFEGDDSDMNWNKEITITLTGQDREGNLILTPLWNLDGAEDEDIKDYKNNFGKGDYFQQTFNVRPTRMGIGSILHNFLLEFKNDFGVENVFSTYHPEDGHHISNDARAFWESRVELERATYIEELNRFKSVEPN
jgi:hypothetical protein